MNRRRSKSVKKVESNSSSSDDVFYNESDTPLIKCLHKATKQPTIKSNVRPVYHFELPQHRNGIMALHLNTAQNHRLNVYFENHNLIPLAIGTGDLYMTQPPAHNRWIRMFRQIICFVKDIITNDHYFQVFDVKPTKLWEQRMYYPFKLEKPSTEDGMRNQNFYYFTGDGFHVGLHFSEIKEAQEFFRIVDGAAHKLGETTHDEHLRGSRTFSRQNSRVEPIIALENIQRPTDLNLKHDWNPNIDLDKWVPPAPPMQIPCRPIIDSQLGLRIPPPLPKSPPRGSKYVTRDSSISQRADSPMPTKTSLATDSSSNSDINENYTSSLTCPAQSVTLRSKPTKSKVRVALADSDRPLSVLETISFPTFQEVSNAAVENQKRHSLQSRVSKSRSPSYELRSSYNTLSSPKNQDLFKKPSLMDFTKNLQMPYINEKKSKGRISPPLRPPPPLSTRQRQRLKGVSESPRKSYYEVESDSDSS